MLIQLRTPACVAVADDAVYKIYLPTLTHEPLGDSLAKP